MTEDTFTNNEVLNSRLIPVTQNIMFRVMSLLTVRQSQGEKHKQQYNYTINYKPEVIIVK